MTVTRWECGLEVTQGKLQAQGEEGRQQDCAQAAAAATCGRGGQQGSLEESRPSPQGARSPSGPGPAGGQAAEPRRAGRRRAHAGLDPRPRRPTRGRDIPLLRSPGGGGWDPPIPGAQATPESGTLGAAFRESRPSGPAPRRAQPPGQWPGAPGPWGANQRAGPRSGGGSGAGSGASPAREEGRVPRLRGGRSGPRRGGERGTPSRGRRAQPDPRPAAALWTGRTGPGAEGTRLRRPESEAPAGGEGAGAERGAAPRGGARARARAGAQARLDGLRPGASGPPAWPARRAAPPPRAGSRRSPPGNPRIPRNRSRIRIGARSSVPGNLSAERVPPRDAQPLARTRTADASTPAHTLTDPPPPQLL
ncbi:basic salivary proline-rich protein 1-like [Phyllostomus discolor]|uniref:Basic salivary proline-rich protein 1-like n=1 Tax=Phyllostomus discolor TaxID=89673 RepID=A0A6J2MKL0_9CHIR|nr:basic salivary proline-rich protein 1-like [Phyllostomus discolor]